MFKKIVTAILAISMMLATCAGCSEKTGKQESENSTVRWYMPITSLPDTTRIHEMAQDYILEQTGIKTELIPVNMGDYETKLQMINASRETYDLSFVSSWMNFYNNNIRRGALVDITELIKEYAPQTYANIPEKFWEAAKYEGKLYAVINQQIMARGPFLAVHKRNDKILNIDFEQYDDFVDALDVYLKAAYEYSGEPTQAESSYNAIGYGFDEFLGEGLPAVVDFTKDEEIKVFNQYETPQFKRAIEKAREWKLNGYTPLTDEFSLDYKSFIEKTDESVLFPVISIYPTYKPGVEAELLTNSNYDINCHMIKPGVVSTYSVTSTMTGVSTTSENPENALRVVEIVNNDKYLFNLLCYGIEGEHYTKIGENRIETNPNNPYVINNWSIGNIYNNYLTATAEDNVWEDTKKLNDEAYMSPLAGFHIDLEPIKIEFQNCNSVVKEYLPRLQGGFVDVETGYAEFMDKLETAGVDKLIEECQRQVDEWLKTK